MADDKYKRAAGQRDKPAECGVCGLTPNPCPSCPRMDGKATPRDGHWTAVIAADPELGRLQRLNAIAARNISIRNEGDSGYNEWMSEYRKHGNDLLKLYEERRAGQPPSPNRGVDFRKLLGE